ncbi:ribonuclease P protein subunit p38 [Gastrophryne carolinensis]
MADKGPVRKPKPPVSKTSLNSPFEKVWTPVVGEDMQKVLEILRGCFTELGLKKIEVRKKLVRKSKKAKEGSGTDPAAPVTEAEAEPPDESGPVTPGWTHSDLRTHLAIGINEVTRALERHDAHLVLVCKSAKPAMITTHLIELSASRGVPACQLPRLSENVAHILGLKSVLALGFRKSSDVFVEQVKAIAPMVPPLNVAWLGGSSGEGPAEEEGPEEQEPENKNVTAATGKRKRPPSQKPRGATELQPLKVKKIVPNPNKKREKKVKKAAKKK